MSISFLVIQTIRVLQLNAGPTTFEKIQINNEEEEKEQRCIFISAIPVSSMGLVKQNWDGIRSLHDQAYLPM